MHTYLAVDIGASSGRHIVSWLENGRIQMQEVYRFENGAVQSEGHLCWDVPQLFGHVLAGMKACAEKGFAPEMMGIDTWGVDYVLLDEKDRPLGQTVAYRDKRTQGMDALLEQTISFPDLFAQTGIAKQPFNTLYQLMAAFKEHPEYRNQAKDFLFMPEYLSFLLTGKKAHEYSIVSTGALLNAKTRAFDMDVIRAAGLPEHLFSLPVRKPGTELGMLTANIAAQAGFQTKVMLVAMHDTGSAYMAVPAKDDRAAYLSSGTWSLLGTELAAPLTDEATLKAGFTNEGGYNGAIRCLKNIMGLWMLQCIRRELDKKYSFAQMADMALESDYAATVDVMDNRFLAPESMMDEIKAALRESGAPEPETISDLLRCVHRSLALCYGEAVRQMSRMTGKTFTALNIVGGGCQNVVLNQMTANALGLPVYAGPVEGTALGNMLAQMLADGVFESLQQARDCIARSFDIVCYTPEK